MDCRGIIEGLEKFFLDIVGRVLPGTAFILGILLLLIDGPSLSSLDSLHYGSWAAIICGGYVIGYALSSLASRVIYPCIERVGLAKPFEKNTETIFRDPNFCFVETHVRQLGLRNAPKSRDSRYALDLRNLALSFLPNPPVLVHRFMFISLMNGGIAIGLMLLSVSWPVLSKLHEWGWLALAIRDCNWWIIALMILLIVPFIEQRYSFHSRAMRVPFSMAVPELMKLTGNITPLNAVCTNKGNRLPSIYLAGGFHSGWQSTIADALPQAKLIDPRIHRLSDPSQYTTWDLTGIRSCNILFAYLEKTNPGGFALALEVGYAKALEAIL